MSGKKDGRERSHLASGAIGAGGAATAATVGLPAPRSPMTNRGRGVRRELVRSARVGGRKKLSTAKFAEISGGRGYRPDNDQYTARMAQAMKKGKVKQNRIILDIYDDNIVQRDGAHRAHAAAMLNRKIKVKAIRHKGEKAPKHISGINMIRDEIVQAGQRSRLKKLGRSGGLGERALDALASDKGPKWSHKLKKKIAHQSSKASSSGVPKKILGMKNPAGAAAGTAIALGTGGILAARRRSAGKVEKAMPRFRRARAAAPARFGGASKPPPADWYGPQPIPAPVNRTDASMAELYRDGMRRRAAAVPKQPPAKVPPKGGWGGGFKGGSTTNSYRLASAPDFVS